MKEEPPQNTNIIKSDSEVTAHNIDSVIPSQEPALRNRSAEGPRNTGQNNTTVVASDSEACPSPRRATPQNTNSPLQIPNSGITNDTKRPTHPVYPTYDSVVRVGTTPGIVTVDGQEIPEFDGWHLQPFEYHQAFGVPKRRTIIDLLNAKYSESMQKWSQKNNGGV